MWPSLRKIVVIATLLLVPVIAAEEIRSGDSSRPGVPISDDYQTFILKYTVGPLVGGFPTRDNGNEYKGVPLQFTITAIYGDDQPKNPSFPARLATYGCQVSKDGRVNYFSADSFGSRGGYSRVTSDATKQIAAFIAAAPGDGFRIPPPNRRVVVQLNRGSSIDVRVYDRAQMPSALLKLLRVLNCSIEPLVPQFAPSRQITRHDLGDDYIVAISPQGQVLTRSQNRNYEIWDLESSKLVQKIDGADDLNAKEVAFSPDGSLIMIVYFDEARVFNARTGKLQLEIPAQFTPGQFYSSIILPHFLADGRILSYQHDWPIGTSSRFRVELRCLYDTTTWQALSKLPGVPDDALDSFDLTKEGKTVVLLKTNVLVLWDTVKMRAMATLDQGVVAKKVVVSPDGSMVAIITAHYELGNWTNHRIRIWKFYDGKLVQELHWNGQGVSDEAVDLLWTADSNDLVTLTNELGTQTCLPQVWNIKTGRVVGAFTPNCPYPSGLALVPGGKYIATTLTGGKEDTIAIWDLDSVLSQIQQFQSTLPDVH